MVGKATFARMSFAGQFLAFSLVILLAGMLTIGLWIQAEVRQAVIARTAGVTALYVDSFISPVLQDLDEAGTVTAEMRTELDRLFTRTSLGRQIVAFKVWLLDGTVAYSQQQKLIGTRFEPKPDLLEAFAGNVVAEISDLSGEENIYESERWDLLIETYAPVRAEGDGRVIAVSEFYQLPDALLADIRSARIRSWAIVGIATAVMYLLLVGIVRRASNTIAAQRSELQRSVTDMRTTLEENRRLHERTRRAAERTTALNERYLHRISADLHDGPAQDIALALLRMDSVSAAVENGVPITGPVGELNAVRTALDSALADLRGIARGLRLPEIDDLSPEEIARRVVGDVGRITGRQADLVCRHLPDEVPLSIKITIYRVLHEALANSFRHAGGARTRVQLEGNDGSILIEVSDDGPGFDPASHQHGDALGLAGMRERVEVLGGRFEVTSSDGTGTSIRACLPLSTEEPVDG